MASDRVAHASGRGSAGPTTQWLQMVVARRPSPYHGTPVTGAEAMDVPTRETLQFFERHLQSGRARLLEVGCGDGRLAQALGPKGFRIVAIDPDATAVDAARARGIDARRTAIEDFQAEGFDAVLFTRSLHHVVSLDAVLARAAETLKPDGAVLVEDFDHAAIDPATALWFYDTLAVLEMVGRMASLEDPLAALDPSSRWQREHAEPALHDGARMRAALSARFEIMAEERTPYLYRSAAARFPDTPDARGWVERLLALESERIRQGALRPIGLRFVAKVRATRSPR